MISRDSLPPRGQCTPSPFLPDPGTVAVVAPQGKFCETSFKIIMTIFKKWSPSKYNKHILCMFVFPNCTPEKNQSRIRGIIACIFSKENMRDFIIQFSENGQFTGKRDPGHSCPNPHMPSGSIVNWRMLSPCFMNPCKTMKN